ncbi:MAG: hypothetical protein QXF76_01360, partial [Candidatus Anstonellales archaeon]
VLRNIADRILNYYENSKTADGKERAYKAMEIVEWMLKNLKNPNSINALKQFLEATFGDKQTKTENFQANSVLVGVLVYMFNDVNVLIKRQRELSSRENLYNNLLNKVKNFLNEFLPMIANNHELARKIGITVSVYDSKIGKVYSDGIAAMRNSLPLGLQNDQIIQELLKAQQVYYLRGEMDISFGQKLLYQAVTRLGLSSRYKEAIKNNNFSFFRRDYGDGNSIVEFDLMAATATITNQGPLGSNNTFKFNFENTRTYRAWVYLSQQLTDKFKDVFDDKGQAKAEYKQIFDLLRKDLAIRTNQPENSLQNLTDMQVLFRLAYLTIFYSNTDREFSHIPGMARENSSITSIESSVTFEYFESRRNKFWVFNPNHTIDQEFISVFGSGFAAQDLIKRVELFAQTLRSNVDQVKNSLQASLNGIENHYREISDLINNQQYVNNKELLKGNLEKFREASLQIAVERARTVLSATFNGSLDENGKLTITHLRGRTLQEALDPTKLPIFLLNPQEDAGQRVITILSQNQEIQNIVGNFYAQQGQSLPPIRTGSDLEQTQQASTTRFVILESYADYENIQQQATQQQFVPIQQAAHDRRMQIEANKYYSYDYFSKQKYILARDPNNNPLIGILQFEKTPNPSNLVIKFYRMEDVSRDENGNFNLNENVKPVHVATIQIRQIGQRNIKQNVIHGQDILNALKINEHSSITLYEQLGSNTVTLEFVGQQGERSIVIPKGTVLFSGKDEQGEFTASLIEVERQGSNMKLRIRKKYNDNHHIDAVLNVREFSYGDKNGKPHSYITFSLDELSKLGINCFNQNIQIAGGQTFTGIYFGGDHEVYEKGLSVTLTYQDGQHVQILISKKQENLYEVKIGDKTFSLTKDELNAILKKDKEAQSEARVGYLLDLSKLEETIKQKDKEFNLKLNKVKEYSLKYKDAETRQAVRNTAEETQITVTQNQQPSITSPPFDVVQPPQVERPTPSPWVGVSATVGVRRPSVKDEVIPHLQFDVQLSGEEEGIVDGKDITSYRQTQAEVLRSVIIGNAERAFRGLIEGNVQIIQQLTASAIVQEFIQQFNHEWVRRGGTIKDLKLPEGNGNVSLFIFDENTKQYKLNDQALEYIAAFLNKNKEVLGNYEISKDELAAAFPDKDKTFADLKNAIEEMKKKNSILSRWEVRFGYPISKDGRFYGWGSIGQSVIRGWNLGLGLGVGQQLTKGVDVSLEAGYVRNLSTHYGVPVVNANLTLGRTLSVGYQMRGKQGAFVIGIGGWF